MGNRTSLVLEEDDQVVAFLPLQGVDPDQLVEHQRPEGQSQGYEHRQNGAGRHQGVAPQVDEGLTDQEEEGAHAPAEDS